MKKNLLNIGPFLIIAALVYAAGWYLPKLTATVNQGALESNLGLPSISVTQESWDQMDLADQWSSETWVVTQLSDGSGFAARPAAVRVVASMSYPTNSQFSAPNGLCILTV